jgi:succinoglycan biosynthesis transport protein ExoP
MSAHSASPDDIDVSVLGRRVGAALPRLALLAAIVGATTWTVLELIAPRFTAEAQLKLSSKRTADTFLRPKLDAHAPDVSANLVDKEAVATEVIALRSRDLADLLIKELGLVSRPDFSDPLAPWGSLAFVGRLFGAGGRRGTLEESTLEAYYRALQVYPGKDSRAISIVFSATDPNLAAAAANKLAELYQRRLSQLGAKQTQGASDFLAGQIQRLTEELRVAEAEVEEFRASAGLMAGGAGNVTLGAQQLSELNTELSKASAQRSEAEARAKAARDMARRGTAEALADVQRSPLIPRLVEQRVRIERQIAELSATLLPGHPRMKQLNADLVGLNRQIVTEVARLVDSLEKEAGVAAMREASIRRSLDGLKQQISERSGDDVKLRSFEGRARSKRQELETLQASFEAARARNDASAVPLTAEVISRARPSSIPTFPKKGSSAAFATIGAFILGLALVVTRELMAGARRSIDGRAGPSRATGTTAAGAVGSRKPTQVTAESDDREDVVALAPAEIALHLERRAAGASGHRTLVTASTSGRNSIEVVQALSTELSGRGRRVVLVDWSPRGNGIAAAFGAPNSPGIAEMLAGAATFREAATTVKVAGHEIDVLAAGTTVVEDIDPNAVDHLLDALDEAYDHILLHAERGRARELLALIEGRVDVGVIATPSRRLADPREDGPGRLLGFDVSDIEVIVAVGEERRDVAVSMRRRATDASRRMKPAAKMQA